MKLNSYSLAVVVFVLLFGGIVFSNTMNWWQTESTKVPATYTEGEEAGQYNPADIRGSYTFGEISDLFEVSLIDLQSAFRLPADVDPAAFQVKSLESEFEDLNVEMGTSAVRMFVAFYQGLPYEISAEEESFLFPEAAGILRERGRMTAEQLSYVESHIVDVTGVTSAESAPVQESIVEPTAIPTEHEAPEMTVTGKTTFGDLLAWGIAEEEIEAVLGDTMPATQMAIKDYVTSKGLEFASIKSALQAEVDKHK